MAEANDARTPQALFLDVGWTLLHPRQSMWQIFADVGREVDVNLRPVDAEGLVHGLVQASRSRAIADLEDGASYSDSDAEFAAQFDAIGRFVFGAAGVAGDPAPLIQRFLDRFWNGDNWSVFPDVPDSLDRLRDLGLRLGVVSNAASSLLDFLDYHGLLDRFDFTVVSAVEGIKKPDRRIFEIALQRAGTTPADTTHVGDMYLEDIVGAQRVGIRSFLIDRGEHAMFPNHREPAGSLPDDVRFVRNLREVVDALESA